MGEARRRGTYRQRSSKAAALKYEQNRLDAWFTAKERKTDVVIDASGLSDFLAVKMELILTARLGLKVAVINKQSH